MVCVCFCFHVLEEKGPGKRTVTNVFLVTDAKSLVWKIEDVIKLFPGLLQTSISYFSHDSIFYFHDPFELRSVYLLLTEVAGSCYHKNLCNATTTISEEIPAMPSSRFLIKCELV